MPLAAKAFLPLILIVGVLLAIGVVYPTMNGPFLVDCGQIDETTCEQIWREVALHQEGLTSLLPITRVRLGVTDVHDAATWCGSVYVERWIFSTVVLNDCL
jgi:hypothetical protein